MGACLMGVYLIGVHLMGMHLMGVHLNRGSETPLVADAEYSFHIQKHRVDGVPEDALQLVSLRNCYFYGVSTSNVKIERLWRSLIEGMMLVRCTVFISS